MRDRQAGKRRQHIKTQKLGCENRPTRPGKVAMRRTSPAQMCQESKNCEKKDVARLVHFPGWAGMHEEFG